MTDVLLKELTNNDIDWLLATGNRKEIPAGTVLFYQGQSVQALYILLDGALTIGVYQNDNKNLDLAFPALAGDEMLIHEITKLSSGEMVGEFPFFKTNIATTTVKTLEKSLILAVPLWELTKKLQEDINFSAHLYRAIAILLADRLDKIINQLANTAVSLPSQLQEILLIFAELHDSDIDWIISAGTVQRIATNTVLIHAGRPVEALYILLDGKLTLSVSNDEINPFIRSFSPLEPSQSKEREFARLSKGSIVGETPFLGASPQSFSVKAIADSVVLLIPRWRMAAKLLHDVDFAARFYRVLGISFVNKQQAIIRNIDEHRLAYSTGKPLGANCKYENELSADLLVQISQAANRFDWMLKKVNGY